jgi:type IV secretory pathway VirB10-like protein
MRPSSALFLHRSMETLPTTPQRQQKHTRQILRECNVLQVKNPRRRRIPLTSHISDESRPPATPPPTPPTSARSLTQIRRREHERAEKASHPTLKEPAMVRERAQRKHRGIECMRVDRVMQENNMDLDDLRTRASSD